MTEVPSIILPITLEGSATPCQVVIVWILASCCSCISLFWRIDIMYKIDSSCTCYICRTDSTLAIFSSKRFRLFL